MSEQEQDEPNAFAEAKAAIERADFAKLSELVKSGEPHTPHTPPP